jgi:hypothetical protein
LAIVLKELAEERAWCRRPPGGKHLAAVFPFHGRPRVAEIEQDLVEQVRIDTSGLPGTVLVIGFGFGGYKAAIQKHGDAARLCQFPQCLLQSFQQALTPWSTAKAGLDLIPRRIMNAPRQVAGVGVKRWNHRTQQMCCDEDDVKMKRELFSSAFSDSRAWEGLGSGRDDG